MNRHCFQRPNLFKTNRLTEPGYIQEAAGSKFPCSPTENKSIKELLFPAGGSLALDHKSVKVISMLLINIKRDVGGVMLRRNGSIAAGRIAPKSEAGCQPHPRHKDSLECPEGVQATQKGLCGEADHHRDRDDKCQNSS